MVEEGCQWSTERPLTAEEEAGTDLLSFPTALCLLMSLNCILSGGSLNIYFLSSFALTPLSVLD